MSTHDDRYWDRRLETLPLDELAIVQDHRLQWQMQRCWLGSPFYRERIERAGLGQRDVRARADLIRLPILTDRDLRADWRANPPLGSATVAPADWWAERQPLDGDDDAALISTDGDLVHRAGLAARALWALGARPGGRAPSLDIRAEGPAARAIAEAVVRDGLGNIGRAGQGDTGPDGSGGQASPTAAIWFVNLPADGLRAPGPGSAEPYLVVGHPRVGATLAFECAARTGLHWPADHYLLEVVEPSTFMPLADGRTGALLVTHLTREGSPLVRYWTGYETRLDSTPCPCGRTGARSAGLLPARPLTDEG